MIQSELTLQPLSEQELVMLETFLASPGTTEESMASLEMIDGYMTAIVIGPEMINEHRWIRYMLDPENRREKLFESTDDEERIVSLLNRHISAIADQFKTDPEDFLPLYEMFSYSEDEERELAIEE
jgi:uncharacterized protein